MDSADAAKNTDENKPKRAVQSGTDATPESQETPSSSEEKPEGVDKPADGDPSSDEKPKEDGNPDDSKGNSSAQAEATASAENAEGAVPGNAIKKIRSSLPALPPHHWLTHISPLTP